MPKAPDKSQEIRTNSGFCKIAVTIVNKLDPKSAADLELQSGTIPRPSRERRDHMIRRGTSTVKKKKLHTWSDQRGLLRQNPLVQAQPSPPLMRPNLPRAS